MCSSGSEGGVDDPLPLHKPTTSAIDATNVTDRRTAARPMVELAAATAASRSSAGEQNSYPSPAQLI